MNALIYRVVMKNQQLDIQNVFQLFKVQLQWRNSETQIFLNDCYLTIKDWKETKRSNSKISFRRINVQAQIKYSYLCKEHSLNFKRMIQMLMSLETLHQQTQQLLKNDDLVMDFHLMHLKQIWQSFLITLIWFKNRSLLITLVKDL